MIDFGITATDTVTGATGQVTKRMTHMSGRVQWCIERLSKDGSKICEFWIDEGRLTTEIKIEAGLRPPTPSTQAPAFDVVTEGGKPVAGGSG